MEKYLFGKASLRNLIFIFIRSAKVKRTLLLRIGTNKLLRKPAIKLTIHGYQTPNRFNHAP